MSISPLLPFSYFSKIHDGFTRPRLFFLCRSVLGKGERQHKCKIKEENIASPGIFYEPLLEDSANLFRSANVQ